jgi:hypothetical protein
MVFEFAGADHVADAGGHAPEEQGAHDIFHRVPQDGRLGCPKTTVVREVVSTLCRAEFVEVDDDAAQIAVRVRHKVQ